MTATADATVVHVSREVIAWAGALMAMPSGTSVVRPTRSQVG
jgi:hypothetical protein